MPANQGGTAAQQPYRQQTQKHNDQAVKSLKQLVGNKKPKKSFFNKYKKFIFAGVAVLVVALIAALLAPYLLNSQKKTVITPVTIKFWSRDLNESKLQSIIDEFQTQNPSIKVVYEKQSDTEYKERIVTRLGIKSNNIANIVEIDESWIEESFANLSVITDPTITGRYTSNSIKNNSLNGVNFGVPFRFDALVLVYNPAHIAEINFNEEDFNQLDWSALVTRAKQLTKTKKSQIPGTTDPKQTYDEIVRAGMAVGSPVSVTNADQIFQLLLIQNDANIYNTSTKKFKVNDRVTQVVDFYTSFSVQNVWADYMGNDLEAFASGKASMVLATSKDIDKIKKLNPNLEFKTAFPAKIGAIQNISRSRSLVLPNYMPNQAESLKFLEFLTRTENSIKLYDPKDENVFIPAQIASLNQIPKTDPYSVFSDLNPVAERFVTPNYEDTTLVFDNFLRQIYLPVTPGKTLDVTKLSLTKLEQDLNNSITKK